MRKRLDNYVLCDEIQHSELGHAVLGFDIACTLVPPHVLHSSHSLPYCAITKLGECRHYGLSMSEYVDQVIDGVGTYGSSHRK